MRTEAITIDGYTRKPLPTLRDVAAVLFRQRRAMLIMFGVVIVAAVLSGKWMPTYQAKMKILVLHQRSDAIVTSSANMPAPFSADQVTEEDLNSEVELLDSEDLLRKVVLATGLDRRTRSSGDRDKDVNVAKAVRKLAKDLKVDAARKSNVISVTYTNRDPQLASQVLQALSKAYSEKHLELHHSSGEFQFFDQETEQYQQGLDQAQLMLTEFTKTTGVVSAQVQRDAALGHASDFDAAARQAQAALAETEQRVKALQTQLQSIPSRKTTVVRSADNPQLFQQLKTVLLNLELKRTELLIKYEPTYRLVQEVDQQIAETKRSIASEESKPMREESTDENPNYLWVQSELTKAQADLSGLKARAATAASIAGQYHQSAERLDQDERTQRDLVQAARTQEENYLLYLHKREEARINDALDQRGIVNVAMAELPVVPAIPTQSPLAFAFAALLVAGAMSVSTAIVLDLVDPTFRTPDELATYLEIPVLASLPSGGG